MSLLFRLLACLPLALAPSPSVRPGSGCLVYLPVRRPTARHLQREPGPGLGRLRLPQRDLDPGHCPVRAGKGVLELPKRSGCASPGGSGGQRVVQRERLGSWWRPPGAEDEGHHLPHSRIWAASRSPPSTMPGRRPWPRPAAPITVLFRPPKLEWLGLHHRRSRPGAGVNRLKLAPADLVRRTGPDPGPEAQARRWACCRTRRPGAGEGKWLRLSSAAPPTP